VSLPKISSACRHSLLEKLVEASCSSDATAFVLDRKAGSAEKNPVSACDEIALVQKTTQAIVAKAKTNYP